LSKGLYRSESEPIETETVVFEEDQGDQDEQDDRKDDDKSPRGKEEAKTDEQNKSSSASETATTGHKKSRRFWLENTYCCKDGIGPLLGMNILH